MQSKIEQALIRFETVCENWLRAPGRMEKRAPYAFIWHPPQILQNLKKPIGLTLQAITHGNEVGGIDVLVECIRLIKGRVVQPEFPIAFILGNIDAALADRRFVERDLNRSFGREGQGDLEDARARALEPLLEQSAFFLDFHQTIEPAVQPFFIFPYTQPCLEFAAALHDRIPIVTHWGQPFSKDGMCTDEYVNHKGGIGITLELGQKGFDLYHSAVGVQTALAAVHYVHCEFTGENLQKPARLTTDLYTWKAVVPYEEGLTLKEGLFNFQPIKRGDLVGRKNGEPVKAREEGWLLFPKYMRDPAAPAPREIYRIVKKIGPEQLGQSGVVGV